MNELVDTFLEEAHELVADLEKSLLLLEKDQNNKEGISSIFRSMHTLKGSAGMFGFGHISSITHHLESIYQDIRDGSRNMNDDILTITFKTLDQLRILLNATDQNNTSQEYNELLHAIQSLVTDTPEVLTEQLEESKTSQRCTYYIYMLPKHGILRNGINPLYLVDDLLVLGEGIVLPFFNGLPEFNAIEPEHCYMGFEVILTTDKTENEIQGEFLFVEGACELQIRKLSDENSLESYTTQENPWKSRTELIPIGYDSISNSLLKKSKRIGEEAKRIINAKAANIRVSAERLDDLMNLVSELVTTQARLALFSAESTSTELTSISENIEKITRRLRDNAFTMSLVPMENIVVRFQRLVSDLSKELNKEIEFKAEGMDTKIDKSIIEKLTDPILHLLRNSIDHGIENPDERLRAGKSSKGTVKLRSYYSGASVIIEISDDGAGLNLNKIREKAIKQGLIDAQTTLSEKELTELIFLPGFSTATTITGVSGRGVGMDVVKKNIAEIRGEITITTAANKGTTFSIKLPLTLSILDGLLVKVGETDFIIPLASVAKCYEVETAALEATYNNWITLDGKRTPFLHLRKDFGIENDKPELSQVINVPFADTYVGLAVDKIEGEYQAVLKPLGHHYRDQDEFSGATILGNGTIALVLDPNKLIRKLTIDSK